MKTATFAGYHYRVVHRDKYDPAKKDTPSVVNDVFEKVNHLIDYVNKDVSCESDISNYVRDRESLFACRLLERRAVSEDPKLRRVYDVAYVTNIILGLLSLMLASKIQV